jgi:glycosyltransferase involved in cell wall biosynthesis
VIVPVYNAAHTVNRTLDSVVSQRGATFEVITCDDCSTDDSRALLEARRDVIVVANDRNRGAGAANNTAARRATGEYLAFIDADDLWRPGRLEKMAEAIDAHGYDIVTTDVLAYEPDGRAWRYYEDKVFATENQLAAEIHDAFIFARGAVRRELFEKIGGYDESLPMLEVNDLTIRLLAAGAVAGLVDEPLYEWHRQSTGRSQQNRVIKAKSRVMIYDKAARSLDGAARRAAKQRRAKARWDLTRFAAAEGVPERRVAAATAMDGHLAPSQRLKAAGAAIVPRLAARFVS